MLPVSLLVQDAPHTTERVSLQYQKHSQEGKISGPPPRRTKRQPGVKRSESGLARPPSSSVLSAAGEMSSQFFLTHLVRAQMKLASHWILPRSGCCGIFLMLCEGMSL